MRARHLRRRPVAKPAVDPKRNLLSSRGITRIDYKDVSTLRLFISDRGRIRARHVTGITMHQQRHVATAIKNAREMALLPYGPNRS